LLIKIVLAVNAAILFAAVVMVVTPIFSTRNISLSAKLLLHLTSPGKIWMLLVKNDLSEEVFHGSSLSVYGQSLLLL
jgi:hypothetical protein